MRTEMIEVDNRTFLLSLDDMYRERMKKYERCELLECARRIAKELNVEPLKVPVEGYYHEDDALREYFLLIQALQEQAFSRISEINTKEAIERLQSIASSGLYGLTESGRNLLPRGKDPLTISLDNSFPRWSIAHLTEKAFEIASASNDCSLVALAALGKDPVVMTALRESVVLYAAVAMAGAAVDTVQYQYEWLVDWEIEKRAIQFIDTFNALFDENIPRPNRSNAAEFNRPAVLWGIVGRCVRLGSDDSTEPTRHYHWAIKDDDNEIIVDDYWDERIWTTEMYGESYENNPLR